MIREQGETLAHFANRVLMTRSGTIVRHQNEVAAKAGIADRLVLAEIRELMKAAILHPCPYCQDILRPKTISLDHIVPLARGGEHKIENCQIICHICNDRKSALSDAEYRGLLALIKDWPQASRCSR